MVEEKGSLSGANSWVVSAIGNLGFGAKKIGNLDLRSGVVVEHSRVTWML